MRRLGYLMLTGFAVAALSACTPAQPRDVEEKLDAVITRLDKLEKDLRSGRAAAARRQPPPRRAQPDPGKVYAVPVEGAPYKGPEHAKVTVVKAFEFACPFCDRVRPTLDQLRQEYGDDIKIVYKDYLVHPSTATDPALAACAAHKQGKYEEMTNLIWEKGFRAGRNLGRDNMEKLAGELGLDMARFKSDMDSDACKKDIQQDQAALARLGVSGTPAFFINGRFLSGAQPFPSFKRVVDEELKKASERIEKGTKLEEYYAKHVLEPGLKKLER